jgi:hypothetical protein
MHLPNYFIADLPPDAMVTPAMIEEACQALRRNRDSFLAPRSTDWMISTLCQAAEQWLDSGNAIRHLALREGPAATGFSRETLARGLDTFFRLFTAENFEALLRQDLGHPRSLEKPAAAHRDEQHTRLAMARGPEFIAHFAAGNLPIPALMSITVGLLTRSAQWVKCAANGAFIPRLYAHLLYQVEPKLGACLELSAWPRQRQELNEALLTAVDCVTATGSDETIAALRARVSPRMRFLAYGNRVSFGFVSAGVLAHGHARKVATRVAADVAAWDQLGCLSPHAVYVEDGGAVSPEQFADLVAQEMEAREQIEPRGSLPVAEAAAIASRRSFYEVRAAHSEDTRLWCSAASTAWTVVYEREPRFQLSCLHRFIYIKAARSLEDALQGADDIRGSVSTVGLSAPEEQAERLVTTLARWGANRVCPIGKMQEPPLHWRHDGRPALADLVTWTDWEF